MTKVTFEKIGSKLVKVSKCGVFSGWLERSTRRTTGFHSERFTFWSGLVAGVHVSAVTLTVAKERAIFALQGSVTC